MSALVVDPIAALLAAGEGRFEWQDGSLLPMRMPSDEHADEMGFLYSTMKDFAAERAAGRVMPDSYPERLPGGVVRVPASRSSRRAAWAGCAAPTARAARTSWSRS